MLLHKDFCPLAKWNTSVSLLHYFSGGLVLSPYLSNVLWVRFRVCCLNRPDLREMSRSLSSLLEDAGATRRVKDEGSEDWDSLGFGRTVVRRRRWAIFG